MLKYRALLNGSCAAALVLGCATVAHAQDAAPPTAPQASQSSAAELGEVVVTARRRAESAQTVPVSVTVFSAEALERANVQNLFDMNAVTPGLRVGSEGGKQSVSLTLRGIGQIPTGEVTPGVVVYIANVAMPSVGSNFPNYDLSSIQVLKGPQGTLFGRNTLGGAVLVTPAAPTYDFGGYAEGTYGRYDLRQFEGAVNVPIIQDKVALRVAGQVARRDGRTKNLNGGPDLDDIHQDAFRVSLLVEPTDWLQSTTMFDYLRGDEHSGGLNLIRNNAGIIPFLDGQLQAMVAQQRLNFFSAFDDKGTGGLAYRKSKFITNDTTASFGNFTVRNIFGYRENFSVQKINTGANGPLTVPGAIFGLPQAQVPFIIFDAEGTSDRSYLSNELQFLGDFDRFNFIAGVYYNHDKPHGPEGSTFEAFTIPGGPRPTITSHAENENWAVFGQVGFKVTDKLTLNLGGRYSWDKANACGGFFAGGYATNAACKQQAALNLVDGIGVVSTKGEEPSWTVGLDYQATPDLFLYAVTRRGYRGANVNVPVFESPYTTGTIAACGPLQNEQCKDLRPFQKIGEETLTDFEVGSKYSFQLDGARGRFNVAAYRSKYKNQLQFANVTPVVSPLAPDSPNNAAVGVNVADLTIWGVEAEASVTLENGLTVSLNGAYTNQKVDKLVIPPGLSFSVATINLPSPKFSGTIAASWVMPVRPMDGDLVLSGDFYMTDDFSGQSGEKLPGYTLASTRLDWRDIGNSGLTLSFYVRNLLNEKYYQSPVVLLKQFPTSSAFTGEQRMWGAVARYTF